MFDVIATILAWFYDLVPDYSIAIALLTLSLMVLLTPLTLKGTRSMMAMQRLQPEMKKLQVKYKDDRQKLNEEMLKFYRENKINPVGGCLPLLVQMPVFIVLYQVLIKLTGSKPYGDAIGGSVGAALSGGGDAVYQGAGTFEPSYLDPSTSLFQDLSGAREMLSFGIDLAVSAQSALTDSFVGGLPYLVLILGVTATSYIQQKQVSGRNPDAPVNPQQQLLLKLLPAMFAFFSVTLPAGVVVYFLISNLYRMGQQAYISRTMYATGADATSKSGPIEAKSHTTDKVSTKAGDNGGSRPKGLLGALGLGASTSSEGSADTGSGVKATGNGTTRAAAKANNRARTTTKSGAKGGAKGPASRTGGGAPNRSKKKKKRK